MDVKEKSDQGAHEPTATLHLWVPPGPQRIGQPVPISVDVRNDGARNIWMVGVIDGSEEGVRPPRYRPSVTRGDVVVAAPPPVEDPLVGPVRAADFRRLGPGETFDPTRGDGGAAYLPLSTFGTFRPDQPGTYRYTVVLSTESTSPEEWLGRFGQDAERSVVLDLIARVPRLTVTSAVDVEVR